MNCKKPWNEKFIVSNLNRTFCDKEYKSHRKDLLVDREISKLPETMHLAEQQKKIEDQQEKAKALRKQHTELQKQVNVLKQEAYKCHNIIYHIKNGTDKESGERRKFIMACPNNDCRGYLSTQYKCELCELFTCPDCLEIIGYTKNDEHTCNPDSVSSAELIKKDTKPCPTCGIRIFKISGCSQMWCTGCNAAFDYNTGKIDTGVVHNPHYYEHMRQQNNGQVPRNPQDIVCGGLCSAYQLHNLIFPKLKILMNSNVDFNVLSSKLTNIHRVISHVTNHELPRTRNQVRLYTDFQDLRIDYILGKKDKKQMGIQIYKKDNIRKKNTELLHLYEILSVVGIENFNVLAIPIGTKPLTSEFLDIINEKNNILNNLRKYCNGEFAKISIAYNHTGIYIDNHWSIDRKKYKIVEADQAIKEATV